MIAENSNVKVAEPSRKLQASSSQPMSKNNNNQRRNYKSDKELKASLKSEFATGLDPNDANAMRGLINKHARKIEALSQDLARLQALSVKTSVSPLATAGSLLTGDIANALHQLVNPGTAPAVGYPGLVKASYARANFTPFKSIPLSAGLGRVIATPYGRYQVYVASNAAVNPSTAGNEFPIIFIQHNSSSGLTNYLFRSDINENSTRGHVTTNPANFSVFIAVGAGRFVIEVPESLVGCTITFAGTPVYIVQGGRYEWYVAPDVADATCVVSTPVASALYADFSINFDALISDIKTMSKITVTACGVYNYNVVAGENSTYTAWQAPAITGAIRGGYLKNYLTTSASLLLGMDASSLSNGGYINAASSTNSAYPPAGVSFDDWISGFSNWFYKGKAKDGNYQIYIPDVTDTMLSEIEQDILTPWTGNKFYNMIITINNSFNGVGGVPVAIQTHMTYESIIATTDMSQLIPTISVIEDPGFRVALALLRKYYNPSCNPDHFDAMAGWLTKVMSDLQTYGSRVIHSPITKDIAKTVLTRAVPFIVKNAPAALAAVGSLL